MARNEFHSLNLWEKNLSRALDDKLSTKNRKNLFPQIIRGKSKKSTSLFYASKTGGKRQLTMRELYQLRDLKQEIAEQQARLARLRGSAEATHSPAFQAGHGSGVSDGVGVSAAKIADLELAINRRLEEYWRTYVELEIYIDSIPDSFTRRIFRLRFIDGKSWGNIAWRCGGGCTADSVRKMCRRYVEKN